MLLYPDDDGWGPDVATFTTVDENGVEWAKLEVYTWPEDPRVPIHGMGSDSLDLLSADWKNVPRAQRYNAMRARYELWKDGILNPPAPEPIEPADALSAAAEALAQAQLAVEAARGAEVALTDGG